MELILGMVYISRPARNSWDRSRGRSSSVDRRKWRIFKKSTIFNETELHKVFFVENLCVEISVTRRITAWCSRGRNKQQSMIVHEIGLHKVDVDESLCVGIAVARRIAACCSRRLTAYHSIKIIFSGKSLLVWQNMICLANASDL